jgi:hypothetical protein
MLLCLALTACQQPAKVAAPEPPPTDPRQLTEAEKRAITNEILGNWDLEVMKGCPWGEMAPVNLEIALAADGAVTGVKSLGVVAEDSCTRRAHETAQQAVRQSSPLAVPPGKVFASVRLRLRPIHATW